MSRALVACLFALGASSARGACLINFNWRYHAGMSDSQGKVENMKRLALTYGCDLLVPPPGMMLSPVHNDGVPINQYTEWKHFYSFGPRVWTLPYYTPARFQRTHLWVRLPSVEAIEEALKEESVYVEVSLTNNFWDEGVIRTICGATGTRYRTEFCHDLIGSSYYAEDAYKTDTRVSKRISDVSDQIMSDMAHGNTTLGTLQLRRGDKLSKPGNAFYVPCSEPCGVKAYVEKRMVHESPPPSTLFVATNERSAEYLLQLRARLEELGFAVVMESDIEWESTYGINDNYSKYCVLQHILYHSSFRVHFHPHEDSVRSYCQDFSSENYCDVNIIN